MQEVYALLEAAESLTKQANELLKEAALAKSKAKILCTHPSNMVVHRRDYHPGGYLNTDYTDHYNECLVCNAKSEITVEDHGTYA